MTVWQVLNIFTADELHLLDVWILQCLASVTAADLLPLPVSHLASIPALQ